MTDNGVESNQKLRRIAEEKLKVVTALPPKVLSLDEANQLLHELQVHQIELEIQNEELRRTQLELNDTKERYYDLYDLAPIGYCTLSEQGQVLEANLTSATLLGVTRNTLVRQPFSHFILPEDKDIYYLHRKALLATGEQQDWDMRMLRGDGSSFWAQLQATLVQEGDAAPVFRVVLNDATTRKLADNATKQNELRLKRLVDILQHPSETIKDFLDYALNQAIQLTGSKIGYIYHYHEDRKEFVLNTWSKEVMAECSIDKPPTCYELDKTGIWGETVRQRRSIVVNDFQTENPLKKGYPEGHVQLLKFMTVPIFNGESIVGVVGLANKEADYDEIDILQVSLLLEAVWKVTDRMRAEISLKESESRYAMTIAAVDDGLWDWDVQSGRAFFSPIYYSILGYDDRAFVASYDSWRPLVHPEDIDRVEQDLQQSIDTGVGFTVDLRMKMKSGEWLWVSTRGKAVEWNSQGKALRMVGTLSNITERKHEESEKLELQAHLNQAQKMEAIGVLAGGIAHDFNNILGVILGYTEMAREDAPPYSKFGQDLDKVLTSAHRAKELVKQILAFSRQSSVDRIPIKIQALVKESLKMLRASIPSTITIKEDIHPQCAVIRADPTQVYQIIMNLCTNAFHSMEKTGGMLTVTVATTAIESPNLLCGQQLSPGEYVELTIRDTGTGIGPDIIEKIFDPYFTTKEVGKATGMGLSITHGIIKGYGGAITVESTIGQGTTFHVYFPVVQEEEDTASTETQEATRGKGSILFVDDEELLAEMGKDMLERLGYTVTSRSRSIEALATFMEDPAQFDLVITDQTMPGLTGIELAKRILQVKHDIPIILCTGFSQLVDEDSAKIIGIKEFALKPLTKSSIALLVSKFLDGEM